MRPDTRCSAAPNKESGRRWRTDVMREEQALMFDGEDPWAAYYAEQPDQAWVAFIFNTCADVADPSTPKRSLCENYYQTPQGARSAGKLPILIDSGTSGTVVGMKWLIRWTAKKRFTFGHIARDFRFGDGEGGGGLKPSMGTAIRELYFPSAATNRPNPAIVKIANNVANANVPLLISKKSLAAMGGEIDFPSSHLQVERNVEAQLINRPIWHIGLPENTPSMGNKRSAPQTISLPKTKNASPAHEECGLNPIADEELKKAHLRLFRHSEFNL